MNDEDMKRAQDVSAGRVTRRYVVTLKSAIVLQLKRIGKDEAFQVRTTAVMLDWPFKFKDGYIGDLEQLEPQEGSRVPVRVIQTGPLDPKETKLWELTEELGGPVSIEFRADLVQARQEVLT
jgi:hypothetical protein